MYQTIEKNEMRLAEQDRREATRVEWQQVSHGKCWRTTGEVEGKGNGVQSREWMVGRKEKKKMWEKRERKVEGKERKEEKVYGNKKVTYMRGKVNGKWKS